MFYAKYAICDLATYLQYQIAVYTVGSSRAGLDLNEKEVLQGNVCLH